MKLFPPTIFLNEVSKITDHIYLTGFAGVTNRNIKKYGITCLVSVIVEVPSFYITKCEVYKVRIFDRPSISLFKYFDQVSDKLAEIENKGGRALINCFGGVSRSPVMCLAFLMKYHGMSLRDAHAYMLAKRIYIRPNINFWRQLVDYELKLFGTNSVSITQDCFGDIPDLYTSQKKTINFIMADIYIRAYEIIYPSELRKKLLRIKRHWQKYHRSKKQLCSSNNNNNTTTSSSNECIRALVLLNKI